MRLRGKLSLWLIALVVLIILLVIPAASNNVIINTIQSWISEYEEAVEQAQDDDDEDDEQDETEHVARQVALDEEALQYAGVETLNVSNSQFFEEIKAQAQVVDIYPLLTMRSHYNQMRAAKNLAAVAEASSLRELERLRKLAKGSGSVATKNVSYAEASWRQARAELEGLKLQLDDIEAEVKQQWGEEIASWILTPDSKALDRLLQREDSLLLVALPVGQTLPEDNSFIRISRGDSRELARKAYFVASAFITEPWAQGETYYFRTATGRLRPGMRLDAWLVKNDAPLNGVFIPEKAIVWYSGQSWCYVEIDEGTYQRRSLETALPANGGVFLQQGIDVGEPLVIAGAQMLLSEEFRWQIQDEDDD